jgi:hypothetical protein
MLPLVEGASTSVRMRRPWRLRSSVKKEYRVLVMLLAVMWSPKMG